MINELSLALFDELLCYKYLSQATTFHPLLPYRLYLFAQIGGNYEKKLS